MWANCLKTEKRNVGGHPKIETKIIQAINSYMRKKSHPAANRFLKRKDAYVRYRDITMINAYNNFKYKKHVCLTSFYKYMDKLYKKPHQETDLCDLCEYNKVCLKFY
jgi:hypothetical protein